MKTRLTLILVLMSLCAIQTFAQEVRGVETRVVCVIDCPETDGGTTWSRTAYISDRDDAEHQNHHLSVKEHGNHGNYYYIYAGFGYEFTNLNSIAISVDAELYTKEGKLIDSKSFVLKSKESYIWKRGAIGIDIREKEDYYVKYKAYKLL